MEISLDKNITLNQCTKQRKYSSKLSRKPTKKAEQKLYNNSNNSTESEEWFGGGRIKRWGRRRCRRCRSQHSALRSANIVQHNTELDSPNFTRFCDRIHTRASLPHFAQQNVSFVALSVLYFIIVETGPVSKSVSISHVVTYFIKPCKYFSKCRPTLTFIMFEI